MLSLVPCLINNYQEAFVNFSVGKKVRIIGHLFIVLIIFLPDFAQSKQNLARNGDYVILLHGIAKSSSHMQPLAEYLEKASYDVINLDYPSTDYTLQQLVDMIQKDIAEKVTKDKIVHYVGYSMGGILARAIIHKYKPRKLGRVVQLAPPNAGSEIADVLKDNYLYKIFFGPAGQQLTTNNEYLKRLTGNVNYEIGIIAGNDTIDPISSYIIPGEDDGKVSITSTKLSGMKDHVVVDASHMFFPSNADVKQQTVYFLKHGRFNKK